MLEIRNICSGYGKKQVLYDVSLEVHSGETVLLSGGNGSGKSTLLKCIYNLLPLWSGEIFFEGEKISGLKPSDLIRKGIVYIPQKDFCFENLTVEENLQIAGTIYSKTDLEKRISKVYENTGLEQYRTRKPFNLSGGERKLLAFGMGLIHQPRLILFDEPLAGVDAVISEKILSLLDQLVLRKGISSILIEHRILKPELFSKKINMRLGTINRN